ncbi:hypothetical protein QR685DRAFT_202935 [Neurospora intermedia]|uniref:Uncharacterized protein n=1 Tax=Neurospora intermedia TaxID=5142 RepID=A0ABR3DGB3_NEUIN
MAWHACVNWDSVPGMRRPLTGCPCSHPWLHVTASNSTGKKCTHPAPVRVAPHTFSRHSLLQVELGLSSHYCHPSFFQTFRCLQETRKEGPHNTRPQTRQTRTKEYHVRLRVCIMCVCNITERGQLTFLEADGRGRDGTWDLKLASKPALRTRYSGIPGQGQDSPPARGKRKPTYPTREGSISGGCRFHVYRRLFAVYTSRSLFSDPSTMANGKTRHRGIGLTVVSGQAP